MATARRGRDREGRRRALPSRRAPGHGEGQARAHDRRGRRRLAAGQGGGDGALAALAPRAPLRLPLARRHLAAPARRLGIPDPTGTGTIPVAARLDALGLVPLLAEVRRPRRVAQPLLLVTARQVEQRLERAG